MTAILLIGNVAIFSHVHFDKNIGSARHLEDDTTSPANKRIPATSTARIPPTDAAITHVTVDVPAAAVPAAVAADGSLHHAEAFTASAVAAAASALPFEPASVAFRDMSYTVKLPRGGGDRVLLHRVSGYALPGRMLALMGASGAGEAISSGVDVQQYTPS